jgi:hypothetical protein
MRNNNKDYHIPLSAASGSLWCCVTKSGNILAKFTIAETEKQSIALFLDGATATWDYFKREHGWDCVQITITIHDKKAAA